MMSDEDEHIRDLERTLYSKKRSRQRLSSTGKKDRESCTLEVLTELYKYLSTYLPPAHAPTMDKTTVR